MPATATPRRGGSPRFFSPRPETPEVGVSQGRRNADGVQLLDEYGNMSIAFEACLAHIFTQYCTPKPGRGERPRPDAVLNPAALDQWARDTNGSPFSEEQIEEMKEFLDVDDAGNLTYKGYLQLYSLQTENDEEETWRDLSSHGFDRNLQLVSSRGEEMDVDEGTPVPMSQLRGFGLGGSRVETGDYIDLNQ